MQWRALTCLTRRSIAPTCTYPRLMHHTRRQASSTSPLVFLAGFNTLSTLPPQIYPCPISSTLYPLPPVPPKASLLHSSQNTVKGNLTRRCAISSTAILPPTDAPTQCGSSACRDPNYEPPPPTDPSSPTLSRSRSVNSRRASSFQNSTSSTVTASPVGSNALSSLQTSSKIPGAHWPPECRFSVTCLNRGVCCEQANPYLRQHSYIYTWDEVREIWPQ